MRIVRWACVAAVGSLLAAGTGCGGSGGNDDDADPVTLSLLSVAAVDGVVIETGGVNAGGSAPVGDSAGDAGTRSFYRFDLSAIPPGATIQSALLVTRQTDAGFFGSPYTDLGALVLDHVDIGADLGPEDFASAPFAAAFAVLSNDLVEETKTVLVTARVQADLDAGRSRTDLRLRFATDTDSDGSADLVTFSTAEFDDGTGVFPTLIVTYQP